MVNPSALDLIQEGMRKALGRIPTSGEKARALDYWYEDIKNDLWMSSTTHELLESEKLILTVSGIQNYSVSNNISDFERLHSAVIVDGDVRDKAQAGGSNTITLSADDSAEEDGRTGREILLIAGTGAGQLKTIVKYDSTTKIATVDSTWTTNPDSTTYYVIISHYVDLDINGEKRLNQYTDRTEKGRPTLASLWNDSVRLWEVPDKIYGLKINYWVNIQKISAGTTEQRMLREYRGLFTHGFYVKTLQDEHEPEYLQEFPVYMSMINAISANSMQIGHVKPYGF